MSNLKGKQLGNVQLTGSLYGTASYALNSVVQLNTGSFATTGSNQFNGNQTITGSLNVTGSIIGTLTGTATTASYVLNAISSSYSTTASYASNSATASYVSGTNVNATSGSFTYVSVTSKFITQGTVFMYTASLPTTDPGIVNQLWRNGSYLMISTGSAS